MSEIFTFSNENIVVAKFCHSIFEGRLPYIHPVSQSIFIKPSIKIKLIIVPRCNKDIDATRIKMQRGSSCNEGQDTTRSSENELGENGLSENGPSGNGPRKNWSS